MRDGCCETRGCVTGPVHVSARCRRRSPSEYYPAPCREELALDSNPRPHSTAPTAYLIAPHARLVCSCLLIIRAGGRLDKLATPVRVYISTFHSTWNKVRGDLLYPIQSRGTMALTRSPTLSLLFLCRPSARYFITYIVPAFEVPIFHFHPHALLASKGKMLSHISATVSPRK